MFTVMSFITTFEGIPRAQWDELPILDRINSRIGAITSCFDLLQRRGYKVLLPHIISFVRDVNTYRETLGPHLKKDLFVSPTNPNGPIKCSGFTFNRYEKVEQSTELQAMASDGTLTSAIIDG